MPEQSQIQSTLDELFGERRPTRWVTRERPKIDRIACPWLIRRFIDPWAEIRFVPTASVFDVAKREGAVAFDIPGATFTHDGEQCSFDALVGRFGIADPGVAALVPIVRGADTDRHDLAPEAAGLHALALGMSALYTDDRELLERGLLLYDALYAWAMRAKDERHGWRPEAIR
jgi:hypothetical protein